MRGKFYFTLKLLIVVYSHTKALKALEVSPKIERKEVNKTPIISMRHRATNKLYPGKLHRMPGYPFFEQFLHEQLLQQHSLQQDAYCRHRIKQWCSKLLILPLFNYRNCTLLSFV